MMDIVSGYERGVHWTVDMQTKVNPIIFKVYSEKGEEVVEMQCEHEPIFGYDVSDNQRGEKILDDLINKYATE